jgi:hypothetical protein
MRKTLDVLLLVFMFGGTCLLCQGIEKIQNENKGLREEVKILQARIEREKTAAFKQGVWYYRTTVLHQTLLQE